MNPRPARIRRVFGEPRYHTDSELADLSFAADGSLWSIEDAGWLRHWAADGRCVQRTMLSDIETMWAFSPDGSRLVTASDDLTLWDGHSGAEIAAVQQPSWVTAVAVRPDNGLIATGHDDGRVRLWATDSEHCVGEYHEHKQAVSALAFNADGSRLASAGEDRAIHIWGLADRRVVKTLEGHTDRVPDLAWHPSGTLLASAGWDTTARLWDVRTGQPIILLNSHADQVLRIAFSPDGKHLACADSDHVIHVWNVADGYKTIQVLHGHSDEIRALAFNRDGSRLASAGLDRAILVWDAVAGQLVAGRNAKAKHAVATDGTRLASSCGGTALAVWDLATGAEIPPSGATVPNAVAFSPDGRWFVAGGNDSYLKIWERGQTGAPRELRGHWGPVGALTFASDPNILASACATDGTCWAWKIDTEDVLLLVNEAADGCSVEAIAYHPNSRLLACGGIDYLSTSGADGAIGIWDITDRKRLMILEGGVVSLSFHPSGRYLAAASLEESIAVWDWDASDDTAPVVLAGHPERVSAVAYTPDGKWLLSGGQDRTLRLWEAPSGELRAVVALDTAVQAIAFSPDGTTVFTANGDTTCSEIAFASLLDPV